VDEDIFEAAILGIEIFWILLAGIFDLEHGLHG
jgi:hypothetical protein